MLDREIDYEELLNATAWADMLNIVWIIVNVLLYTGTSVLLTFTTDAVFQESAGTG